jgi:nitrite reductase/ring-hydroxylating ferredoxin subunit
LQPRADTRWHRAELGPDGRGVLQADGQTIAVFLADGAAYAVANSCPHAGNPLVEGEVLGGTLVCAYHGWRFDLETGACLSGTDPVRSYPAEIRDGAIWVAVTA